MKFEYKVIKRQWPITGDEMNDWGERGWELAGVTFQAYISNGTSEFIYYFKREKKNV
jgi:hypothetical protein